MSNAAAVIRQLQAARESTCELQPGVRIKLRRPPETEMPQFYRGISVEAVKQYAVGWEGMSTAVLFGEAVGSTDALDFSPELWAEIVVDKADWVGKCSQHLADQITAHIEAKAAIEGNSSPSSTQAPASSSRETTGPASA